MTTATKKLTPARAARLRKLQRDLCGCNRCVYTERNVIAPALTFAEHEQRLAEWELIIATPYTHKDWSQLPCRPF